jgi:hypothetical protein
MKTLLIKLVVLTICLLNTVAVPRMYLSQPSDAYETPQSSYFWVISSETVTVNTTVTYSVGGTATSGLDYTALSGSIVIPAGQSSAILWVNPLTDTLLEGNETVLVQLLDTVDYELGSPSGWYMIIRDNDQSTITVSATDSAAAEPSNTGTFTFTRAGGVTTGPLTVNYAISGTATAGSDYSTLSGSVTFAANATTATVTVTPINDSIYNEGNETVIVTISSSPAQLYLVGSPSSATVNITDNDIPTLIFTSPVHGGEPSTHGSITVSAGVIVATPLSFTFSITGSAQNGIDFNTISYTQTIPAGSSSVVIPITVIDDNLQEAPEQANFQLFSGSTYYLGSPNYMSINISDNDKPTITVTATDNTAAEQGSDTGLFTFTRSGPLNWSTTVLFTLTGTASNGSDYAPLPTSVTFAANETTKTLIVDAAEDAVIEGNETVIVTLSSSTVYTVGSPGTATVTIANVSGWTLNSDIGAQYYDFVTTNAFWPESIPVAIASDEPNTVYVATTWIDNGASLRHSQILKWTSAVGWTTVPNTYIQCYGLGYISSMYKLGSNLYLVGSIASVGDNPNQIPAENVAIYNIPTATWEALPHGLSIGGGSEIRAANWGGGTMGSRTYIYVAGIYSQNGNSVNGVLRAYKSGGVWVWDSMNNGISDGSNAPFTTTTVAVNPTAYWDSTYGYRHQVFVGGAFDGAGPLPSTSATNVAIWNETSGTWSASGSSGKGINYRWDHSDENCAPYTNPYAGYVRSLSWASGYLYIVGNPFNLIDESSIGVWLGGPCLWYPGVSLAKWSASTSDLSYWGGKGAYEYSGGHGANILNVSAAGGTAFVAGGEGFGILNAGSYPGGPIASAPAYRVISDVYYPLEPTPVVGDPATVAYMDVVAGTSLSGFFIVRDPAGVQDYDGYGWSLRWNHY